MSALCIMNYVNPGRRPEPEAIILTWCFTAVHLG